MDDTEARVRCVEAAIALKKPTNDYSVEGVVTAATALYAFVNGSPSSDKPQEPPASSNAGPGTRGRRDR